MIALRVHTTPDWAKVSQTIVANHHWIRGARAEGSDPLLRFKKNSDWLSLEQVSIFVDYTTACLRVAGIMMCFWLKHITTSNTQACKSFSVLHCDRYQTHHLSTTHKRRSYNCSIVEPAVATVINHRCHQCDWNFFLLFVVRRDSVSTVAFWTLRKINKTASYLIHEFLVARVSRLVNVVVNYLNIKLFQKISSSTFIDGFILKRILVALLLQCIYPFLC